MDRDVDSDTGKTWQGGADWSEDCCQQWLDSAGSAAYNRAWEALEMSMTALETWVDDRSLYPIHEEDNVSEVTRHEREVRNLRNVLDTRFPDRLVAGNACIYWLPNEYHIYYSPDAFVTESATEDPEPRVYLVWEDPPIVFAAEVVSRSNTEADREHNFRICEMVLCIPELLEFDPEALLLRMWRLGPEGYESVEPTPSGRLRSVALDVEFGLDEGGRLRTYTLEGELLRTHKEAERDREQAERERDQAERQLEFAEARAAEEARQRESAEARAAEEARQRESAEARAAEEARQRESAEARAAEEVRQRQELERELAALRAAVARGSSGSEDESDTP